MLAAAEIIPLVCPQYIQVHVLHGRICVYGWLETRYHLRTYIDVASWPPCGSEAPTIRGPNEDLEFPIEAAIDNLDPGAKLISIVLRNLSMAFGKVQPTSHLDMSSDLAPRMAVRLVIHATLHVFALICSLAWLVYVLYSWSTLSQGSTSDLGMVFPSAVLGFVTWGPLADARPSAPSRHWPLIFPSWRKPRQQRRKVVGFRT